MSKKSQSKTACLVFLIFFIAAPVCAGDKEEKEKLDRISARIEEVKTGIIMLEQQAQSLHDAISKAGGEQRGLITQIIRNLSAIRRGQLTVSTNSNDAATQVASIGERITEANERSELADNAQYVIIVSANRQKDVRQKNKRCIFLSHIFLVRQAKLG